MVADHNDADDAQTTADDHPVPVDPLTYGGVDSYRPLDDADDDRFMVFFDDTVFEALFDDLRREGWEVVKINWNVKAVTFKKGGA